MVLDPDQFLRSVSTQQLAALYGFVDQEALLLEPNQEAPPRILSQWRALLLADLENLYVETDRNRERCRSCKSFSAMRAIATLFPGPSAFKT